MLFPEASEDSSKVLLIYEPSLTTELDKKTQSLDAVQQELLKLADDSGEFKSQTVIVEKKWHDALRGTDGTTLNA